MNKEMREAFIEYIKFDVVEEPNPLLQNERDFAVWDTAWNKACKWQIEQDAKIVDSFNLSNTWVAEAIRNQGDKDV